MHVALSIAGSDPTAGAGLQADLKTFAAMGVYGATVVTAVTAQNSRGVQQIHEVPVSVIASQLASVFDEFEIRAVKTGMLPSVESVHVVSEYVREHPSIPLVIDPVMQSSSGQSLVRSTDVIEAMRRELFPLARLITPNIDEAVSLSGTQITSRDEMISAAQRISESGCRGVMITGGHSLFAPATDLLCDAEGIREFHGEMITGYSVHGAGCSFASAIAAGMARGLPLKDSIAEAKAFVTDAIRHAANIGGGRRPLHHLFARFPGPQ